MSNVSGTGSGVNKSIGTSTAPNPSSTGRTSVGSSASTKIQSTAATPSNKTDATTTSTSDAAAAARRKSVDKLGTSSFTPPTSSLAAAGGSEKKGSSATLSTPPATTTIVPVIIPDRVAVVVKYTNTNFSSSDFVHTTTSHHHHPLLKPLLDESSSYPSVVQTCFQLCQYVGTGSSAVPSVEESDHSSALFHDISYVQSIQMIYPALIECMNQHKDRRCKIVAISTLATLCRAVYGRIRPSTLIFCQREPLIYNRIEDEMVNDIPTALILCALQTNDDGIASFAIEALGKITIVSSCTTVGNTLIDDGALTREIQMIGFCKHSVYTPTLRSITDEDPLVAIQEIQYRIYETCIGPRIFQLLERIILFQTLTSTYTIRCLPIMTAVLTHLVLVSPASLYNIDRTIYSKRWSELDSIGLVDTFVTSILLPCMQRVETNSIVAHCASVQAIRLAHTCPNRSWVKPVTQWTVIVLKEVLCSNNLSSSLEDKVGMIATLLIALRAVTLPERTPTLIWLFDEIQSLPSTTIAPVGITTAALLITTTEGTHNNKLYRRPARIGFWTEMALSFFMDGPISYTGSGSASDSTTTSGSSTFSPLINTSNVAGAIPPIGTAIRSNCLKKFLSSTSVAQTLNDIELSNQNVSYNILQPKAEMVYSFLTVAIHSGRRFRITADDTIQIADPNTIQVQEWLKLVWIVLTNFVSCVHWIPTSPSLSGNGPNGPLYLEEDLSLKTACLASYVKLLQEYLHFVGLLNVATSVALKLGSNACPPHIIWDEMTESADFLSKFQSIDLDVSESTTKLMDDIVGREVRQGIPSHHMRLFVLLLAADHWVQCRINTMRKHQQSGVSSTNTATTTNTATSLNATSAREILLSLAPKRLLAKISRAHLPPVDNDGRPKRDPIKKLALECVKVCVACIENIALTAIEWRRRYGSSEESKHIVNVAVGILQGKIDETVPDELAKAVMNPTCDGAITRIQAYYEEKSTMGSTTSIVGGFPQSEIVLQPIKMKIKPLVSSIKSTSNNNNSSSNNNNNLTSRKREDVMNDYFMQLCRQVVSARCIQCIQSCPPSDSVQTPSRPLNSWYRLNVAPVPECKDGRLYGHKSDSGSAWGKSVIDVTAGSDPIQVVLGYTIRRILRYDGEEQYQLTVLMRAHNMTSVELEDGLRLEVGMIHNQLESNEINDPLSIGLAESLDIKLEDVLLDIPTMFSSCTVYKDPIKASDHITWEVTINDIPSTCCTSIVPAVVFRNVPIEPDTLGATWISENNDTTTTTAAGVESLGMLPNGRSATADDDGEDDFHVTTKTPNSTSNNKNDANVAETEDIRMTLQPLQLSPMIQFQPCPLVFFKDKQGDIDSFRLLWFRMTYTLSPIPIVPVNESIRIRQQHVSQIYEPDRIAHTIARMSELKHWDGEAIPGGTAIKLWSYMTISSGSRVYCVLTESDNISSSTGSTSGDKQRGGNNNNNHQYQYTLHFRADTKSALYGIVGSTNSRKAIVEAMVPGMVPV